VSVQGDHAVAQRMENSRLCRLPLAFLKSSGEKAAPAVSVEVTSPALVDLIPPVDSRGMSPSVVKVVPALHSVRATPSAVKVVPPVHSDRATPSAVKVVPPVHSDRATPSVVKVVPPVDMELDMRAADEAPAGVAKRATPYLDEEVAGRVVDIVGTQCKTKVRDTVRRLVCIRKALLSGIRILHPIVQTAQFRGVVRGLDIRVCIWGRWLIPVSYYCSWTS
jgi:hypothetical protein